MTLSPTSHFMSAQEPWVELTEEPKPSAMRFRYQCEGRSAGTILGISSTPTQKSYPTIKIHNCGPAAVVVVSCVTKDDPFYPHPHSLVGSDCSDAVCTLKVKGKDTVSMMNVGIQCCKRNDVKTAIENRAKIRVDPFGTGYTSELDKIDLSAVRLCFQVFLPDSNRKFTRVVPPVVSQPIIDKKLVNSLSICRMSKRASMAKGGEEVMILCDKIKKEDIEVRFFEEDMDGELIWEAYGHFTPTDVHHQCAITFKTPPYRTNDLISSVTVLVHLRRPSDSTSGEPKEWQYIPNDPGLDDWSNERKRRVPTGAHQRFVTEFRNPVQSSSISSAVGVSSEADGRQERPASSFIPLSVMQKADETTPNEDVQSADVPVDFSTGRWTVTQSAEQQQFTVLEPVNNSLAVDRSQVPQAEVLDNGAIILHTTEDGRLILPPGYQIISANGHVHSGDDSVVQNPTVQQNGHTDLQPASAVVDTRFDKTVDQFPGRPGPKVTDVIIEPKPYDRRDAGETGQSPS